MTDNTTAAAAAAVSADESSCPQSQLIPNLLDDISLQCLARVPRSFYFNISLVSKSWHSAVASIALFNARSLLNTTQSSIYLNLRINSGFHWYTLLTDCLSSTNHPSKKYLVPLPPIPSQKVGSAFAVVGPKIYVIGGSVNEIPSNCMWVLDCRFGRWIPGPKMRVGREFSAAGVVGGKIYVIGGCVVDNWTRSTNWAEVFDPVMESWAPVPSPIEGREKWMHASAVIEDRLYAVADRGGVVYDVGVDKWGNVSKRLDLGWRSRAAVVEGVLYCYDYLGKIRGYDVKNDSWKELKGVETGLPRFLCGATMVNLDGRLCVLWEAKDSGKDVRIMCAEVEVSEEGDGSLNGKILWSDEILVVPKGAAIVHCLAAEF